MTSRTRSQIIERLNKQNAPLPPKCSSSRWQRGAVIRLLGNTRYRGVWPYGEAMNVWQNRAEYNRQIKRDEPLDVHVDEDLRIIDDELWYAAQKQIEVERERQSHRARRGSGKRRYSSVLNGLCYCGEHKDQVLTTCGAHGRYLRCPACKDSGDAYLSRFVDRELTTRLITEAVGTMISSDKQLTAQLKQVFTDQVAALQRNEPGDEHTLHQRLDQINKQIERAKRAPVVSNEDEQENRDWLRELRADRAEVQSELARLKTLQQCAVVPTDEEVEQVISSITDVLADAAVVGDVEHEERVHRILKLITGGRIEIHQSAAGDGVRPTLKAVFNAAPLRLLLNELNAPDSCVEIDEQQVTIEINEPSDAELLADEAKALEDEGLLIKQIVQRLTEKHGRPISRGTVVKALDHWYESRGLQRPDGRSRRSTLEQHTLVPTTSGDPAVIARVMDQFNAGKLYQQIADELEIDRNTVTKIVKNWHADQGLPVPDGRSRRKALDIKSTKKRDADA
ncbi:MAG: recombinase family protein [Planctomycetota bacterium]